MTSCMWFTFLDYSWKSLVMINVRWVQLYLQLPVPQLKGGESNNSKKARVEVASHASVKNVPVWLCGCVIEKCWEVRSRRGGSNTCYIVFHSQCSCKRKYISKCFNTFFLIVCDLLFCPGCLFSPSMMRRKRLFSYVLSVWLSKQNILCFQCYQDLKRIQNIIRFY